MKQKRIPLRMCLGCQEMKPKKELIRIVRDKEGNTSVDFTGKKAGRGAYVCKRSGCFDQVAKYRRLDKAFSGRIDTAVYDILRQQLEDTDG